MSVRDTNNNNEALSIKSALDYLSGDLGGATRAVGSLRVKSSQTWGQVTVTGRVEIEVERGVWAPLEVEVKYYPTESHKFTATLQPSGKKVRNGRELLAAWEAQKKK
jgi:hypothetical protein